MTIDEGSYTVGYALEIRVISPVTDGAVSCQLDEVSGRLATFQQTPSIVDADTAWTMLSFSGQFDVPNITVSIRCHPLTAGQYSLTVRGIDLYATPT